MSTFFVTDPATRALVQEGLLERLFHDSLYPELLFRKEYTPELWDLRAQQTIKTRAGLLPVDMSPLAPATDPTPGTYNMEQWDVTVLQRGASVETDTVVAGLTLDDLLSRDIKTLGLQGGQTVNQMARNAMFNAANYGHTYTTTAGAGTTKAVPFLNGFTRAFNTTSRKFDTVSVSNPLVAYFWNSGTSAMDAVSITGYTPTTAGDEMGPGTLTLAASYTSTSRQPLIAATATYQVNGAGGYSVDSITSSTAFTLAHIRNMVAHFRQVNVQPCEDGFYHVHLDPVAENQLFNDSAFQLLFRGRGLDRDENDPYAAFEIGIVLGCKLYRNNECPTSDNVGTYGTKGADFAAPTANATSVPLHQTIFIGREALIEYWKDCVASSVAGITGKIGNWNVTNNGLMVDCDRVQMILRSPIDAMQRVVRSSWSFFGAHLANQDYLYPGKGIGRADFAGSSRYKRVGVVITGE